MKKIQMNDLWRLPIGATISVGSNTGIYLGREEWGHIIWTGLWEEVIDEWEDEDEVTVWDMKVDYEKLVEIKASKVAQLAKEGWTLDKNSTHLNINTELEELEVLTRVRDLVNVAD